jgi:hypothetical protein
MQRLPLINRFQGCLAGLAIAAHSPDSASPDFSFPNQSVSASRSSAGRQPIAALTAATQIALALSQPPQRLTDDGVLAAQLAAGLAVEGRAAEEQRLDWAIALIPAFLLGHESPECLARLLPSTLLAQFTPALRTIAGLFALALNPSALQSDRWQTLQTWMTAPDLTPLPTRGELRHSFDRGLELLHQVQDWQHQGLSGSDLRLALTQGRSISALDSDLADPDFVAFFYDQTNQLCASEPLIQYRYGAPGWVSLPLPLPSPAPTAPTLDSSSIPAMQFSLLAIALTGTQAGLMGLPLRWRLAWPPEDRHRTLELADRLWYTWSGLHSTAIEPPQLLAPLIHSPRALNPPH